jgi:hypothetical protein
MTQNQVAVVAEYLKASTLISTCSASCARRGE